MPIVYSYSGDLLIHYEEDVQNTSVFSLLEKACITLMKESLKMKSKGLQGQHSHRSLLVKMLWCKYNVSDVVMSVISLSCDSITYHKHLSLSYSHSVVLFFSVF